MGESETFREKIIDKKKDGKTLTEDEIQSFTKSIMKDLKKEDTKEKSEEQMKLMLASMFKSGIDENEEKHLVGSMISPNIGAVNQWPEEFIHFIIDEKSLSGIDEKITLLLAPVLAASLNIKVLVVYRQSYSLPSGERSKLEMLPGFRVVYNQREMCDVLNSCQLCIVGEDVSFAPGHDILSHCKMLIPENNLSPLITMSVMWKQKCEKIRAMIFNVKYGMASGLQSQKEAQEVARDLMSSKTVKVSAFLTSTEKRIGEAHTERMEVHEIIEYLKGRGPSDVKELACEFGIKVLQMLRDISIDDGKAMIEDAIKRRDTIKKFQDMIMQQGVPEHVAVIRCSMKRKRAVKRCFYQHL